MRQWKKKTKEKGMNIFVRYCLGLMPCRRQLLQLKDAVRTSLLLPHKDFCFFVGWNFNFPHCLLSEEIVRAKWFREVLYLLLILIAHSAPQAADCYTKQQSRCPTYWCWNAFFIIIIFLKITQRTVKKNNKLFLFCYCFLNNLLCASFIGLMHFSCVGFCPTLLKTRMEEWSKPWRVPAVFTDI